ncbi:ABC transporter permease [Rhizobium puerariae]|uniref:ABC transporter permease n=1 Tax=Rhizobium puerariae TaxID=1585791 RepID=A0ABV6AMV5_9HYPH
MLRYILRRCVSTLPVILVVAVFIFSLLYIAPGDPALIIAGDQASPEVVQRIREQLGLNQPAYIRFFSWCGSILTGDLGTSVLSGKPVSELIAQRIQPTVSLMLVTLVMSVGIAVPLGVLATWRRGHLTDRLTMLFCVAGFSLPVFVTGYLLAYVFGLQLRWLPVQGYSRIENGIWPWFRNLILPAAALSSVYIALITRITRATLLEIMGRDYIRTARAKGMSVAPILFIHALKNAAVPIITVIGTGVALLIGGSVVAESVFAIPGLGRLTIDAILSRDYPVIQAVVLIFSLSYVVINLIIDLLYTVFDPRIRY